MPEPPRPGPLALVGSGEYLPVMEDTDRALLEQVGGAVPRVVVLPTAAGLEEPGSPARWARMGLDHFRRLGAHVEAVPILRRDDALDPRWSALLEGANLVYFSGGDPRHLVETMRDTPAWEAIHRRHLAGAALAGCSAGAMAVCALIPGALRMLASTEHPEWRPALGMVPNLAVLPHFDRMARFTGPDGLDRALAALPAGTILLGIDEDTALVRGLDPGDPDTWEVTGRQSVSVYAGQVPPLRYTAGERLTLPPR